MRFDFLREPISADDPCGPDLEETGDAGYSNYVLLAESRLPQRFFQGAEAGGERAGLPFDKTTVDAPGETRTIAEYLTRTRDLRLLALDARFHILSGDIVGFGEALEGLSILALDFWPAVHPRLAEDGDSTARVNVIEGLVDFAQIVLPLQYAPIATVVRIGPITYRHHLVASGQAEAREREDTIAAEVIARALADEKVRPQVQSVLASVVAATAALSALRQTVIDQVGHAKAPKLDALTSVLAGIEALIRQSVPELKGGPPVVEGTDGEEAPAEGPTSVEPVTAALDVPSASFADRALQAVEQFFLLNEASNPALLLVHQSRMLIGRPLVEALESLLPQQAERAEFRFEGALRFTIDLSRMRLITEHLYAAAGEPPAAELDGATLPAIANRDDVAAALRGVGKFYRANEPSSPVPVLLDRALSFLSKDFNVIVSELIPKEN